MSTRNAAAHGDDRSSADTGAVRSVVPFVEESLQIAKRVAKRSPIGVGLIVDPRQVEDGACLLLRQLRAQLPLHSRRRQLFRIVILAKGRKSLTGTLDVFGVPSGASKYPQSSLPHRDHPPWQIKTTLRLAMQAEDATASGAPSKYSAQLEQSAIRKQERTEVEVAPQHQPLVGKSLFRVPPQAVDRIEGASGSVDR